uniref:CCHC-type domain-containing protein n=1 Tax=Nicotiana tabacum TaxID=4097 RepID=A0A1S4DDM2_TOBAC|nr:PREDICTED: uncharacterized protein LOC107828675 [Nicotiana tabacum]
MNLSLAKLLKELQAAESIIKQQTPVVALNVEKVSVSKSKGGKKKKKAQKVLAPGDAGGVKKLKEKCYHCKQPGHHKKQCPAYLAKLNKQGLGCPAHVLKGKADKLESRIEVCIFIGYPKGTKGGLFYCPKEKKEEVNDIPAPQGMEDNIEASVPENDVVIQQQNPTAHVVTSRSGRIIKKPLRFALLGESYDRIREEPNTEPLNYDEALQDTDADKWVVAMKSEIESMYSNQVWDLVELPTGVKPIGYDILLNGNNVSMLNLVKEWLSSRFDMKDLGQAAHILGIKLMRDRKRRILGLSQALYIDTILTRLSMQDSKKGFLPFRHGFFMSKNQSAKTTDDTEKMKVVPYASAVGSLMYAMLCTRLDICFVVGMSDSDSRKSTSGYIFTLGGGAISWRSIKQSCVADSTMEAEYVAASEAAKEVVWLENFLK